MTEEYVLGVKINTGFDTNGALKAAVDLLAVPGSHYISTTNAEFVIDAQKDQDFKRIVNESDLSVPDGSGILYALYYDKMISKLKGKSAGKSPFFGIYSFLLGVGFGVSSLLYKKYSLGQTVTGVELMDRLCGYASQNNKSVILLGGQYKDTWGNTVKCHEDMAKSVQTVLEKKYPGLNVIGATSTFGPSVSDDDKTLEYIHKCMKIHNLNSIDFVFVAYGHPKQEKWIYRNRDKIPAKVCMGVGGTFDYISGSKKRCPEVLRNANLEWLYKLVTQPWRIKRIIKAFPTFPYLVYLDTLKRA